MPFWPGAPSSTSLIISLHSEGPIISVSPVPIAVACIIKHGLPSDPGMVCDHPDNVPDNIPVSNVYVRFVVGFVMELEFAPRLYKNTVAELDPDVPGSPGLPS